MAKNNTATEAKATEAKATEVKATEAKETEVKVAENKETIPKQKKNTFPKTIVLSNISPTDYVISSLGVYLSAGEKNISISFTTQDMLQMAKLNIETFNRLNDWDGIEQGIVVVEE